MHITEHRLLSQVACSDPRADLANLPKGRPCIHSRCLSEMVKPFHSIRIVVISILQVMSLLDFAAFDRQLNVVEQLTEMFHFLHCV